MRKQIGILASFLVVLIQGASCSKEEWATLHPKGKPLADYPTTIEFTSNPGSVTLEFESNVPARGVIYGLQQWITLTNTSIENSSTEYHTTVNISVSENTTGEMRTDTLYVLHFQAPFPPKEFGKYAIVQY